MNKNNPVYDFLGFRLLQSIYNREHDTTIEYFTIKIINSNFDLDTNLYQIVLEIKVKFLEYQLSRFYFDAVFRINDLGWKEKMEDDALNSLFTSAVFPCVREKIYSITNDIRGAFTLPIIDLRQISLTEGAKFFPKQHNE